jgi:hypothetical protein
LVGLSVGANVGDHEGAFVGDKEVGETDGVCVGFIDEIVGLLAAHVPIGNRCCHRIQKQMRFQSPSRWKTIQSPINCSFHSLAHLHLRNSGAVSLRFRAIKD